MSQPDSTSPEEKKDRLEGETGHRKRHFRGYWNFENTKVWAEMYRQGMSCVAIASEVDADPGTVSVHLKEHGIVFPQGHHRVDRKPPKLTPELAKLLVEGPEAVLKVLDERIWGISASSAGIKQLTKFCDFVRMPLRIGTIETASKLDIHRTMVKPWTEGKKRPYLVSAACTALQSSIKPGWKLLSMRLESGGNVQGPWIRVPLAISGFEDISGVVSQLTPLEDAYNRGAHFDLSRQMIDAMKEDLFSYLLGIMGGDASKGGGEQKRFNSSNIDLQLALDQPSNERLGDFVCTCVNALGIRMDRKRDKQPSGSTRFGREPSAAYRWISQRSPLVAWMFNVGLGLH
jgi:hypothetical protein